MRNISSYSQLNNRQPKSGLLYILMLLILLPILSAAQSGLTGTTVAGGNGYGSAANQLATPLGVFADGSGNVFVADFANSRIQKFVPSATSGTTVAGGNGIGSAANQVVFPTGVFVDGPGNLFVVDNFNSRIQKFAPGSLNGVTVVGGSWSGLPNSNLNFPSGVFIDGSGNMFVADRLNHRIQKFAPGSSYGTPVAGGNGKGSAANQLSSPSGVFVDGSGNVFVADEGNHRIQKFAPGATMGITVAGGNGEGSAANQLSSPYGLFLDGSGNIFVADSGNDRIQKFAPGATDGVTVAGGEGRGAAADQLSAPTGVFVDGSGNILVADSGNDRIQKFSPIAFTTQPAESASVCQGENVTASATATSNAPLSYQWFKGDAALPSQTTSTLSLSDVQPADAGNYSLRADNGTSTLRSELFVLTVNARPTLTPGPDQSTTLGFGSNCTDLSATASGGSAPYTYQWSGRNETGGTINVCPETTTTYTVTATDANGCVSPERQVTVEVQDVRCGNKLNKVEICYYGVTQCVSQKIAKRYLKLGATIGGCGSGNARLGAEESSELPLTLSLKAYPNPVQDALTVDVLSPTAGRGTFQVLDMQGRARQSRTEPLIEGRNEIRFRLGSLPTGLYIIRGIDALNNLGVVKVKKE